MAANNSSAPLKTAEGAAHQLHIALRTIAAYPVTNLLMNMDAANMQRIAVRALEAQAAPAAVVYAEARECSHCNHVGINDSADGVAACISCAWHGDSPKDDKCPECEAEGTMTASCPKCHHEYRLLADASIATPALPAAEPAHAAVGLTDALRDLIDAIEYTPLGIRQIKALERARAAIKTDGEIPATEDSSAGDLAEVQAEPVADSFLEWFAKNYPTDTIIIDPAWHAKSIYRMAMAHARLAAPQAQPADALLRHALELAFDHIDMDSLRLSHCKDAAVIDAAMAAAQEAVDGQKQTRRETEAMAECMDMVRQDLITAGVVDKSVPPMMLAEAVIAAQHKAVLNCREAIAGICDEVAKRSQEKASLNNGRESDMCFGQVIAAEAIAVEIRARGTGREAPGEDACSWYSGNYGGWHSSCGTAYVFESGGPVENGHKFCHCCGKRLKVTDTKDTNDNP